MQINVAQSEPSSIASTHTVAFETDKATKRIAIVNEQMAVLIVVGFMVFQKSIQILRL